jgi:divinyl protochlorophyllide a 8-vinyl-reductase
MYGTTKPPAGAAHTTGAAPISGSSMRGMLVALQKVAGRNYETLLTAAGLARYLTALPAADQSPAATGQEVAQLNTAVYQILGEALTRLFHRNLGETYAAGIVQNPAHQTMRARIQAAPREQQLALFVQETSRLIERGWPGVRHSEDSTAWYWTIDQCVVCAGVQHAMAPICGQLPALVSGLGKALLGRRPRVAEVECRALGAPACRFAIYKD